MAAFVPDLMDRSRIGAALTEVEFVASAAELVGHAAQTVILDLGRPGVLDVLPSLASKRTVGFASHVDGALISAALAAGCNVVLPRSRFFAAIADAVCETG